jgi:alkaline phosphatase
VTVKNPFTGVNPLILVVIVGFASVFLSDCSHSPVSQNNENKPQNIILLIGDGMGPAHIKAYRKFVDKPETPEEEKLVLDPYLVGSLSTEPSDSGISITDSAASATAFATGTKTINGALSVDSAGRSLPTVLEKAKVLGLSTGLVATSEIVHATPAAFASHHLDRDQMNDIADQYFDNQHDGLPMVDVMLGGGLEYFARDDRDLLAEFSGKGYSLVSNRSEMLAADNDKLLGLFAQEGLPKMWDRKPSTPSLGDMAKTAIQKLSKNPRGFFLVIEASQIDWAAHDNDIVGVISEMQDFETAIKTVMDFATEDGNTLVIATADHETGGLSIGSKASGEDFYYWDIGVIKTFKYTPAKMTDDAQASGDLIAAFQKVTSLELTEDEKEKLLKVDLEDWEQTRRAVSEVINKRSFTGWTTYGHTGVDVNLYAFGPGSEAFRGHWDNTRVGQLIFELLDQ